MRIFALSYTGQDPSNNCNPNLSLSEMHSGMPAVPAKMFPREIKQVKHR